MFVSPVRSGCRYVPACWQVGSFRDPDDKLCLRAYTALQDALQLYVACKRLLSLQLVGAQIMNASQAARTVHAQSPTNIALRQSSFLHSNGGRYRPLPSVCRFRSFSRMTGGALLRGQGAPPVAGPQKRDAVAIVVAHGAAVRGSDEHDDIAPAVPIKVPVNVVEPSERCADVRGDTCKEASMSGHT